MATAAKRQRNSNGTVGGGRGGNGGGTAMAVSPTMTAAAVCKARSAKDSGIKQIWFTRMPKFQSLVYLQL